MKTSLPFLLLLFFIFSLTSSKSIGLSQNQVVDDFLTEYYTLLDELIVGTNDPLMVLHFQSMRKVVEDKVSLSDADLDFLAATIETFKSSTDEGNPSNPESYYLRQRPMVVAWESPTDQATSFTRLKFPLDWDPNQSYPMYIDLHGLWSVAANPVEFMTYSFRRGPSSSYAFEDGFLLSMWGRGNYWYQGISETDIWEGIEVIEKLFNIDPSKKFITGHSMGGFGAWYIASKSVEVWAGVGIHAGALYYGSENMLSKEIISELSQVPVYFVCGTNDGLFVVNYDAYDLLMRAGNENITFVPFTGGHDYLQANVENMYDWLREFDRDDFTNSLNQYPIQDDKFPVFPNLISKKGDAQLYLKPNENYRLELFNLLGEKVFVIEKSGVQEGPQLITMPANDLMPGVYLGQFTSQFRTLKGRIMVQ